MADLDLVVQGLRGGYGKLEVLHGISFSVSAGDVLCILGPNGCGKSTLLKLLLRFLPKTDGTVCCRGHNTDHLNRKKLARFFSYIPQTDQATFPYTALEMVMMARSSYLDTFQSPKKEDIDLAYACLEKLKLGHLADFPYNKMSGGQRQLVLIARALCQNTCILVMDEPTASLDFANQKLINDAIHVLGQEGKIVLVSTHSPAQPFAIATKVLLMQNGGAIGFGPPKEVLTDKKLEAVYGVPMEVVTVMDRNKREQNICLTL